MITDDLDFEDREVTLQVLADVGLYLTARQAQVMFLCCQGYTQDEVAQVLEVNQSTVQRHFGAVVRKVKEIAARYA